MATGEANSGGTCCFTVGAVLVTASFPMAGRVAFDQPVWQHVSPKAKQLITSLLKPDPNERPTAAQVQR